MVNEIKAETAARRPLDERLQALGHTELEVLRGQQQLGASFHSSFDNSFDNSFNRESFGRELTSVD